MIEHLVDHVAIAEALTDTDGWRGSLDGRPTFFERHLFDKDGCQVTLHRFIAADDPQCFHSHPALAIRMVLSGGYEEEFSDGRRAICEPGFIGLVTPEMTHRVDPLAHCKPFPSGEG